MSFDRDRWVSGSLSDQEFSLQDGVSLLSDNSIDLMPLLSGAYEVRRHYWGKSVQIHIINNAQNGSCPEDCSYCAQSKDSTAEIEPYRMKSDDEILAEAKRAYESGAHRYCMVLSGRGPKQKRVERFCNIIQSIKSDYPMEVCLSAGLLDDEMATMLKQSGLDRLNHNFNTSESHYDEICTTHTFADRVNTLQTAKAAGLELCSGIIVGMGESLEDIVSVALKARQMGVNSIPVNFLIPIPGTPIKTISKLTPEFCLRVLCLFRFFNPQAEIRIAAGREQHLRSLQPLAFYPANSLFMEGYLNTKGTTTAQTLQMIKDLGFQIESDQDLDAILAVSKVNSASGQSQDALNDNSVTLKLIEDLRPTR